MVKDNKSTITTKELKNKVILITGGAGSIGTVLTKKILEFPVKTVRVWILTNMRYSNWVA